MSRSEFDAHLALSETPKANANAPKKRRFNLWPVIKWAAVIITILIIWSIL